MAEPHLATTLQLSSAAFAALGSDVQWEIELADGLYAYPTGRSATVSFNGTGLRAAALREHAYVCLAF
jgi:hypothetical protein